MFLGCETLAEPIEEQVVPDEQAFQEEVGLSPKQACRMVRLR
ncbi:MAG: hypothetical protein V4850_07780 [Myxococcota bacterium]